MRFSHQFLNVPQLSVSDLLVMAGLMFRNGDFESHISIELYSGDYP